jgi:hypothetical protein
MGYKVPGRRYPLCGNQDSVFPMLWGLNQKYQRSQVLAVIETYYRYNAFVDESMQERHGIRATSVAAYVATFDRWLKFEEEWYSMLNSFQVSIRRQPGTYNAVFSYDRFSGATKAVCQ